MCVSSAVKKTGCDLTNSDNQTIQDENKAEVACNVGIRIFVERLVV
jgi:hypothetical protein